MKITMDGKYAYRREPRVRVRVLCVDRPGTTSYPVIAMDCKGVISNHTDDGFEGSAEFDLVPLDETMVVTPGVYETREGATAHVVYVRQDSCLYPAIGYALGSDTSSSSSWTMEGRVLRGCGTGYLDLIRRIGDLP